MRPHEKPFVFTYEKASEEGWTWTLSSKNGTKMAVSAAPYAERWVARRAALTVLSVGKRGYDEADTSSYEYPFNRGGVK